MYVLKPRDKIDKHERKELECLRQEVADLELINRAWKIIAEVGEGALQHRLKKTSGRRYPPSEPRGTGGKRDEGTGGTLGSFAG